MKKIPRSATEVIDSLEWKSYLNDREIAHHPSGFFVIKPKNFSEKYPVFCPVCDCSMSSSEDLATYDEVKSCFHCKEKWYYPNKSKWNDGWRPVGVKCDYEKTILVRG